MLTTNQSTMTFAEKLQDFKDRTGATMGQMAEIIGAMPSVALKWIKGRSEPSQYTQDAVLKALEQAGEIPPAIPDDYRKQMFQEAWEIHMDGNPSRAECCRIVRANHPDWPCSQTACEAGIRAIGIKLNKPAR